MAEEAGPRADISRTEIKHVAQEPQLGLIKRHVIPILRPDPHGPEYEVKSVYHDTPKGDCFRSACENYPERFKIRTRTYNGDDDTQFHELKAKHNGLTLKRSLSEAEFAKTSKALRLEPAVEVKYDREAYEDEVDGLPFRLTMDRGIRARPAEGSKRKWRDIFDKDQVIVEMKTGHELTPFSRRLVRLASLEPVAISKFVASLARLHG